MGCLLDVDHAGSRAAKNTSTFGSRLPEAGRRREPIGVLGRTTRSVTAGRSRPRHIVSNHCHIRKELRLMDLLTLAKNVAQRVEAQATQAKVPEAAYVGDVYGYYVLLIHLPHHA